MTGKWLTVGVLAGLMAGAGAAAETNAPAKGARGVEAVKKADGQYRAAMKGSIYVIDEGRGEPASIGSYSIRIFEGKKTDEDLISFLAGVVRARDGGLSGAWVSDLDGDGRPEVLVWMQSAGSGSYGVLEAFTFDGKQLTALPPLPELTKTQAKGYQGHDGFKVAGGRVVREFPVYAEKDTNASPTGGQRSITFELENGAWKAKE